MPQVDKVTFFPIVLWTFLIYIGGYLVLNTTFLYSFMTQLKASAKRSLAVYNFVQAFRRLSSALLLFTWISL